MKKILVLTIAMFSLLACSSSEDENIEKDPIIGTWFLFSRQGENVNECEMRSNVVFKENGTYTTASYSDLGNQCVLEDEDQGNWSNKGNSNYAVVPSEENTEDIAKIVFSDNNNTFTIVEDDLVFKKAK